MGTTEEDGKPGTGGIDINVGTTPGTSPGGTSTSGGSSGGSASVDPQVSAAMSFYYQLWGTKPPAGYIEHFLDGTRDLFDFIKFQLSRPNADNQIFFRDRFATYAQQAASIMGRP
jgi:hypothetical protein